MISYVEGPLDGKSDTAPVDLDAYWNYEQEDYVFKDHVFSEPPFNPEAQELSSEAQEWLSVRAAVRITLGIIKRNPDAPPPDTVEREFMKRMLNRVMVYAQENVITTRLNMPDDEFSRLLATTVKTLLRVLDEYDD